MATLEEIKKNFQTYANIALISAIAYLYFDNKKLNEKIETIYSTIITEKNNNNLQMQKALDRSTEAIINNYQYLENNKK